jgi:hypothetical protein
VVATPGAPIPEAKAWAQMYDGSAGPLIDLSQAVPGYSAHPELLARLGAAASSPEAGRTFALGANQPWPELAESGHLKMVR